MLTKKGRTVLTILPTKDRYYTIYLADIKEGRAAAVILMAIDEKEKNNTNYLADKRGKSYAIYLADVKKRKSCCCHLDHH
jgi:hypothetical protein